VKTHRAQITALPKPPTARTTGTAFGFVKPRPTFENNCYIIIYSGMSSHVAAHARCYSLEYYFYSRHVFFASTPHSERHHDSRSLLLLLLLHLLSRERAPQKTKPAACSKSSPWTTSTARRRSNLPFSARFVRKSPSSSRSCAATIINTGRKKHPRIRIRIPPLLPRIQTPMTTNRRRWTF